MAARENFQRAPTARSCASSDDCYSATLAAAEAQYGYLNQTTLDMLMLDYPSGASGCGPVTGQWRALEELYRAKRVRTIAVSNFSPDQLQCLAANASATAAAFARRVRVGAPPRASSEVLALQPLYASPSGRCGAARTSK